MATRSNIGIRERDGVVWTVYSHWDGYPQHVGRILFEHYTTEQKVRDLLALGDISELHATLDDVVAYHRDHGETKAEPRTYAPGTFARAEEYAYVWDVREGRWYWSEDEEVKALTQEDVQ